MQSPIPPVGPIYEIIAAIDHAARIFLNPNDPLRQEAESQLTSVFSKEMSQSILDRLFRQLTEPQLVELLEEELNDPLILDGFRPRWHGGLTRAYGPERITHILPGNIPDVAIMSLVFALLTKSASMVKVSSKAPSLVPFFLRALEKTDQGLAESIVVIPDRDHPIRSIDEAFHWANLIILYGSYETIDFFRPHIPKEKKTIVYGPKYSIGIVSREEVSQMTAAAAARDIAMYDQKGCLSPHIYYVEEGVVAPRQYAQWVAAALDKIAPSRGPIPLEAASKIQQLRGTIPLTGGAVFASKESVDWTVLYDPDTSFTPSPLCRTIFIKPVQDISEIHSLLEKVRFPLQGVGVAVASSRLPPLLDALALLGASRFCPIGKMQESPLTWHHDGRFRLLDLLRFVDYEK